MVGKRLNKKLASIKFIISSGLGMNAGNANNNPDIINIKANNLDWCLFNPNALYPSLFQGVISILFLIDIFTQLLF